MKAQKQVKKLKARKARENVRQVRHEGMRDTCLTTLVE